MMADTAGGPRAAWRRPRRSRWVRFAKAASTDLSQIIYETATAKGLDVGFAFAGAGTSSTRTGNSSNASTWGSGACPWDSSVGDGSKEQVYNCIKGHLEQLELTEEETGLVLMMAYGLMKAPDLEIVPTTWRAQLMAALRVSVVHGLKPESKSKVAANNLQNIVALWRPSWQQDYTTFLGRGDVGPMLVQALAAAQKLTKHALYKDSERLFEVEAVPCVPEEAYDPEDIASI